MALAPMEWLAVERRSRLVVGFHIGGRGQEGALGLWPPWQRLSIPKKLRRKALVFTDDRAANRWDAYATVFAKGQHQVEGKRQTTIIEQFNNTLRQRCARLVRKTLSFSKTWENHYLAIKYFLVHRASVATILRSWQKIHPYVEYTTPNL
ncbi:MAG: IS1 family transposase [Tunicatimonas sp.]|uniref:IS1 family transposase n=1 Tax=Tunicatimonas sp. TaxID=1940096 RepID=UPI003C750F8A